MKLEQVISKIAKEAGITKAAARTVINSLASEITEGLMKSGKIVYPGFGAFEVVERSARKGRNPRTKEPLDIPASKGVKFRAYKNLKDAVNADE